MGSKSIYRKLDWYLIGCYLFLVLFGWINIYAALRGERTNIFDFSQRYGMHLVWFGISLVFALIVLFAIPPKFYSVFAWWLYVGVTALLFIVIFIGKEVNGSHSWISLGGPLQFQPAEFSKLTTTLALSALMSKYGFKFSYPKDMLKAFLVILVPMLFIVLEKETGTALVYIAFMLMFYREGMSGWVLLFGINFVALFICTLVFSPFVAMIVSLVIFMAVYAVTVSKNLLRDIPIALAILLPLCFIPKIICIDAIALHNPFDAATWMLVITVPAAFFFLVKDFIKPARSNSLRWVLLCFIISMAFVLSVDVLFNQVLHDYQRLRIEVLLGIADDPQGAGYNVRQAMIAIGSGGFSGKGFLHGTQTRFNFVPEQGTDFIFCTIGEEWGFLGALFVLGIYLFMIIHIYNVSEKHKDPFIRIYGYCFASILLFHVVINICMTIGLMPVIGIPLPFLSYGGSSLLAFSIMMAIFLRLDLERWK